MASTSSSSSAQPKGKTHTFPNLDRSVKLTHVDPNTDEWKHIAHYFESTQGATHEMDADLLDILRIEKPDNRQRPDFEGEKVLLWHGTKRHALTSILNLGLLKNPPGHDNRGGRMFGQGVYFADSFSKSAAYSMKYDTEGTAYVFLAEVCLGKMFPLFESVSQEVIDLLVTSGYHSVKGCGQNTAPKSKHIHNGQHKIPAGKLENNSFMQSGLLYNEYIVYDDNRIKLKYLVYIKDNKRAAQ